MTSIKNDITVVAFPIDDYDKTELDRMSDAELSETALSDSKCNIWTGLESFQYALNADYVDTDNNWIFFLDTTTY